MLRPKELPHYIWGDYLRWEGRWELIEGIPFAMTPAPAPTTARMQEVERSRKPEPSYMHQRISQEIARLLGEALEYCEYCHAVLPVDWKVTDDTVVQPDNLVVCYQPTHGYLTKAPSLIFEILSPSTTEKDRRTKFDIYQREGVGYYCIVDPDERVAKVYRLREGRYVKELDVTDEIFEFLLGSCQLVFDFSAIWKAV